jgi:hypothetical protein
MEKMVRLSTARSRALQRMGHHMRSETATAVAQNPSTVHMKPIAYVPEEGSDSPVHVLASQGSEFCSPEPGKIRVMQGSLFVECSQPQEIITDVRRIFTDKTATLGIELKGNVLRVKSCSMPGSVAVEAGLELMPLRAGHEITLCDRPLSKLDVSPPDGVGRRALQVYSDGHKYVALSEYSIGSLLKSTTYLRPLVAKQNGKHSPELASLMKIAAVADVLGAAHGHYETAPRKTAQLP